MKNNFHLKKMKIILKKLPDSINRMTEIVYGWIIRLDMITTLSIMKNNFHLKKMKIILKKLPDSINRMTEIVYGWIIRLDMITKA